MSSPNQYAGEIPPLSFAARTQLRQNIPMSARSPQPAKDDWSPLVFAKLPFKGSRVVLFLLCCLLWV
jgi:hypothetical protein